MVHGPYEQRDKTWYVRANQSKLSLCQVDAYRSYGSGDMTFLSCDIT